MLRTTPPREGMGVEENCFVRRIEALSFAKTNLDTGRWASGVRAMERNVPHSPCSCLSPIFIPDQDRPRRPALLTLLFLYTAASYR